MKLKHYLNLIQGSIQLLGVIGALYCLYQLVTI